VVWDDFVAHIMMNAENGPGRTVARILPHATGVLHHICGMG